MKPYDVRSPGHNPQREFLLSVWRLSAEWNTFLDRATETLTLAWVALCAEAGRWWEFNRVCAWCGCRLGGNPFAKKTSHGICRYCRAEMIHKS